MSQPPTNAWEWVGRIVAIAVGIGTICAGAYAVAARIFSYVTRTELASLIAKQDEKFLAAQAAMKADVDSKFEQHREERQQIANDARSETIRLHEENRETYGQLFTRTAAIEQGQARIEGRIEGVLNGLQKSADWR